MLTYQYWSWTHKCVHTLSIADGIFSRAGPQASFPFSCGFQDDSKLKRLPTRYFLVSNIVGSRRSWSRSDMFNFRSFRQQLPSSNLWTVCSRLYAMGIIRMRKIRKSCTYFLRFVNIAWCLTAPKRSENERCLARWYLSILQSFEVQPERPREHLSLLESRR